MKKFPFTAILGLDLAKTSLLLHAVDPRLGGVLLSGHRGCAKTTLARAFGQLVDGIVEVPLGATEDRLLGSVDVESVLERNQWKHAIGLLEAANGRVLYVDEVNLLPDSLSDLMLDAAATGTYRLEREGFSREIESRFIMVGSMNPDEGELRPQLSDRFAHEVDVRNSLTAEQRSDVIRRRIAFDTDPDRFLTEFDESELRQRIQTAREAVAQIALTDSILQRINDRADQLSIEGMRTELSVARTARAAAAWDGRNAIADDHLDLAWQLCLPHEPEITAPPESKPPNSGTGTRSRSFSSLQPTDAASTTIRVEKSRNQNPQIKAWWAAGRGFATERVTSQADLPISWRETILCWAYRGKEAGLRFHRKVSSRENFIFVDGSRSAGSTGLLGRVLPVLQDCLNSEVSRSHVLQLADGSDSWLGRRVSGKVAANRLGGVSEAGGKSPLLTSLMKLSRVALRSRTKGARGGHRF